MNPVALDRESAPPAATEPQRTRSGDLLEDRYELGKRLGSGASSTVFLARDAWRQTPVAVKVLHVLDRATVASVERFEAELRAHQAVVHPNVVRLLDHGTTLHGEPFVVTEALVGETLGSFLRRDRRLPTAEALALVREIGLGLEAAHRAGVVHRDVKPDNLFLCHRDYHPGGIKVLDFGFATLDSPESQPEPRAVIGTLEYMAPEQAVAEPTDARADVYSLGVVLFRLLTGELPFDHAATTGLLTHHLLSPIPPPSWIVDDLDPNVEQFVLTACRKHPDNRYPSMAALLVDLHAVMQGECPMGVPLRRDPDAFRPRTEMGKRVLARLRGAR